MCVCVFFPFILDVKFVGCTSRGVTQAEDHTGFLIHLPSAVHAFIFLARRIPQPFLSLVDREAEIVYERVNRSPLVGHFYFYLFLFFSEKKSQLRGFELTSQRVRRLRGYQLSYRGDRRTTNTNNSEKDEMLYFFSYP